MHNCTKEFRKCVITFLLLNIVFVISLWLVCLLPDENIKLHLEQSISILNEEGAGWPFVFSYTSGSQLDNSTDWLMLTNTSFDEMETSALKEAMSVHGYPRYWHGYLVFLRPLMLLMPYTSIRYVNMFLLMFLLVQNMLCMAERIGKKYAYALLTALCLAYFVVIPFSLQFSSVINIMLISNLVIVKKKNVDITTFLVIGMVTNFVDFLTAPLLTLGVPMITLLILKNTDTIWDKFKLFLFSCTGWGVGYFGTWIAKWAIGSIVLKVNIFEDAFHQAVMRTQGISEDYLSVSRAIRQNLTAIIPPFVKNLPLWIILVLIVVFCIWLFVSIDIKLLKYHWSILLVCCFPFIWYVVFMEHSQIHSIFTYRELVMSVYGFLSFLFLVAKKNFNRRNVENE